MVGTMRGHTAQFHAVLTISSGKRCLLLKRPLPFMEKLCHLTRQQRDKTPAKWRVPPMTFDESLTQVLDLRQREKRVSYRALKRRFDVDDDYLEDLKDELIYAKKLAIDEDDRVLVWIGETASALPPASAPDKASTQERQPPISYTPPYLTEKILTSRTALEGERKQVTVLFADLKGSMELLAGRDPEEARHLLDPVLERLMAAVHRYEGTVNQIMGDGIMALFGAPLAP